jgi:predicted acetyltransferase
MPPVDFSFSKVGPDSDVVLRNLFEFYVHDMAALFELDTRPDGSYSYNTTPIWEKGYDVYVAKTGDSPAGFAIIGSADEWLGDAGGHDVHEFFVIRRHRRHGLGRTMADHLWNQYPGEWLVRALEANASAVAFWRSAIASYSRGSYAEEGRTSKGRAWRFFRFTSAAR